MSIGTPLQVGVQAELCKLYGIAQQDPGPSLVSRKLRCEAMWNMLEFPARSQPQYATIFAGLLWLCGIDPDQLRTDYAWHTALNLTPERFAAFEVRLFEEIIRDLMDFKQSTEFQNRVAYGLEPLALVRYMLLRRFFAALAKQFSYGALGVGNGLAGGMTVNRAAFLTACGEADLINLNCLTIEQVALYRCIRSLFHNGL